MEEQLLRLLFTINSGLHRSGLVTHNLIELATIC